MSDRGFGPQFTRAFTAKGDWMQDEPGSPINMVASTPGKKRDGLDLRPDRWRTEDFHRAGGPILWQHDHRIPPIGNSRATVGSDKLRVKVTFDQDDDFARKIESKLRRGFLNSASCGWDFVDATSGEVLNTNRAYASNLARDAAYSLSEVSVVAVPADPMATVERHWRALRSVHPGLAELYTLQEHEESEVSAPELRRAVIDYCNHIGLDLRYIRAAAAEDDADELQDDDATAVEAEDDDAATEPEDATVTRRSQAPDRVRAHGVRLPTRNASPASVDERAAQTVLAAFSLR